MVFHGMSDDDVKYIMQYPFNMPASMRAFGLLEKVQPHPRGYGTMQAVLGKYVREEKYYERRRSHQGMTSLPAQKFHFKDRGLLHEGLLQILLC
jgi:N-acyl-D-amino-acid deacylase